MMSACPSSLRIRRHGVRAAFLALLLAGLSPVLARGATNDTTDTRLQDIRIKIQEAETVLAGETNPVIRAMAEKRRDLLVQDLANTQRRQAIENREQARRSRQKIDPVTELNVFLLAVKGNESIPRQQAKNLDAQFRLLRDERARLNMRLHQLRTASQADPRLIGDLEMLLRIKDEQLTMVLLQRQQADWQSFLMQEADRIAEKIQKTEIASAPTIKAMLAKMREIREEGKRLQEVRQRIGDLLDRQDDVAAGVALSRAKAEQLNEAISIRRERERMEHGRQRLLAWMFSTDEEKEKEQERQLLEYQAAQAQAVEVSLQTSGQARELFEKEIAWLRFRLAGLKKRYAESILVPCALILGIALLHLLLTRLLFPLAYQRDRLFVLRRNTGYLTALLVIIVAVRFFLEDLKDVGTVLGIAGAAVVIALQDLCSAFAGWFVIVASGKFKVGDRVEIAGTRGDVIDIQLLRTTLNELNNWMGADEPTGRVVVIPNSFIFKEKVVNYSHVHPFLWSRLDVIVTFETPAIEARETLWKVLTEETRESFEEARQAASLMEKKYGVCDAAYEPKIVSSIDDSGVTFGLLFVTHYRRRVAMINRLNARIIEEFGNNPRLQFAYPTTRQIPTPEPGGFPVTLNRP